MDYQGNYFPEEQDERESKAYRKIKGVFKWTMYGISFVIYAIIFYMIIVNGDSAILDNMYFTEQARHAAEELGDDFDVYRINTAEFMTEDGRVQLSDNYYAEDVLLLEIGLKFNAKELSGEVYEGYFDYSLTDSTGHSYEIANIVTDGKGRYGYARICFENVNLNLSSNDLNVSYDESGAKIPPATNDVFTFTITRKSDGSEVAKLPVYNNKTIYTRTDYDPEDGGN